METPWSVTVPVFVAVRVYVTTWPTVSTLAVSADFVRLSVAVVVAGTSAEAEAVSSAPAGFLPETPAWFATWQASRSAWITV